MPYQVMRRNDKSWQVIKGGGKNLSNQIVEQYLRCIGIDNIGFGCFFNSSVYVDFEKVPDFIPCQ
jgi:hypothetical protein